jgi:hypothetical protein
MTELIPARHSVTNATILEIWIDGEICGAIYAMAKANGVRIISKHLPHPDGSISRDAAQPGIVEVAIEPPPKPETQPVAVG